MDGNRMEHEHGGLPIARDSRESQRNCDSDVESAGRSRVLQNGKCSVRSERATSGATGVTD